MSNNPFLDYQQQFFKTWTDNMSKIPGMDTYQQMFQNATPNLQEYWKTFAPAGLTNPTEFWKNLQDQGAEYWKNFQSMVPGLENFWKTFSPMIPNMGDFSSMFPYKIPGMELYTKVFELWKDLSNPVTFAKDFQEKYMDLMQDMFKGVLPAGANNVIGKPMELMDSCVNFYKQTLAPWMELDQGIMSRLASGDMSAYNDFFKQFNDKYDETIGKYLNMMGLGLNREANEEQMQAINAYYKAMFSSGELASTVMTNMGDSMKDLVEGYQKGIEEGKSFSTFRDFYNLWYKTTEDSLLKLFSTDEFAKVFDDFADKYSQYTIAMNKVYERALSALPIPTNTDMKSLYKTVYDLRKEVRDLSKAVAALTAPAAETKKEG